MENISRRDFIRTAALGAAGLTLSARSWSQVQGANGDIRVAVIGFHGRGKGHIATLQAMKGVRLVALCDVDQKVLDQGVQQLGSGIMACTDMRKIDLEFFFGRKMAIVPVIGILGNYRN